MAASITTSNPLGVASQTQQFSGPLGENINQTFFNAAFAARLNPNPIYKTSYYCDIIQKCNMSQWLEQYSNAETDCFPEYTLLENRPRTRQIKVKTNATIAYYPGTTSIALDTVSHSVGGAYILPQVGNTIVLSPNGDLAKVTAITGTPNNYSITVQLRPQSGATPTVKAGDLLLVLSGSEISDCLCPTGQFTFPAVPIEHDVAMIEFGDKGELCGDALNKCQWLKIPFTDDCGNTIDNWYTEALQKMYQDHDERKHFERLLNPSWGLIPVLKARGLRFNPASPNEITTDDIRDFKAELDKAGVNCREYAIFAGRNKFSQYQRMLLTAGVTQLNQIQQPLNECKWINLEYCGLKVEGMTLHIYEECTFSNGKFLGGPNMIFPNSSIWVPMCNAPACTRSISDPTRVSTPVDRKMITTVYFRTKDGRVFDNITDSNGVLNGPNGRNTFGTGCEEHEWTIKSKFLQEIHCVDSWGYEGLY